MSMFLGMWSAATLVAALDCNEERELALAHSTSEGRP
jgi:hypothetical protein